ncbi:MAG: ABC transporter permease, partial [Nannocystaceae bacterium]
MSIAFGGFLAVIMTAMQDRSFADFIDTAARMGGGHVTLAHPGYSRRRTLAHTVPNGESLADLAMADEDVRHAVARITGQTMLSTARDSQGAAFIAIDPDKETERTFALWDGLIAGRRFVGDEKRGIVLGERLAKRLGVETGKKVIYTLIDKEGEVVAGMARLSGIIKTGVPGVDGGLCLLPLAQVRELLGYGVEEATAVAVFVPDSRDSHDVAERLAPLIGEQVSALTWDEAQPQLASFIAMKVGGGRLFEL